MRNMSFSLTTKQIQNGTKTVTRRMGWKFLKSGELVRPIVKGMGLKKGEKVQPIRGPLRVINVRREGIWRVFIEPGACQREGFPDMSSAEFIKMFCKHMPAACEQLVTRIEFEYTD